MCLLAVSEPQTLHESMIEIINNKARHTLINAKCRWRSNRLDGAVSSRKSLGQTKVMKMITHLVFCIYLRKGSATLQQHPETMVSGPFQFKAFTWKMGFNLKSLISCLIKIPTKLNWMGLLRMTLHRGWNWILAWMGFIGCFTVIPCLETFLPISIGKTYNSKCLRSYKFLGFAALKVS